MYDDSLSHIPTISQSMRPIAPARRHDIRNRNSSAKISYSVFPFYPLRFVKTGKVEEHIRPPQMSRVVGQYPCTQNMTVPRHRYLDECIQKESFGIGS